MTGDLINCLKVGPPLIAQLKLVTYSIHMGGNNKVGVSKCKIM